MRTFITSEGNGYIKNPDYQLKVWRGLIVENLVYVYQKAERFLNKYEILALHAQMHKTKYGQFSLGDIMAIPKPDATKILEAFGGDEPEF